MPIPIVGDQVPVLTFQASAVALCCGGPILLGINIVEGRTQRATGRCPRCGVVRVLQAIDLTTDALKLHITTAALPVLPAAVARPRLIS